MRSLFFRRHKRCNCKSKERKEEKRLAACTCSLHAEKLLEMNTVKIRGQRIKDHNLTD